MVNLSCGDRWQARIGSHDHGRIGTQRKIYLARHCEHLFMHAVHLLGKTVISYRSSQRWISVREEEYLRAAVLLKNNGIVTEAGSD